MGKRARSFILMLTLPVVWGLSVVVAGTPPKLERKNITRAISFSRFGEQSLQKGDLERAKEYFSDALELVPALPSAHVGLGNVAMVQERFADALKEFEAAREGWETIANQVADLYEGFKQEEFGRAIAVHQQLADAEAQLERFGKSQSGNALKIMKLQRQMLRLEQLPAPVPLERHLEVPGEIFFYIGNALYRLDRLEDAVTAWETCVELSPEFGPAYMNLALVYGQTGEMERALWCREQAAGHGVGPPTAPLGD